MENQKAYELESYHNFPTIISRYKKLISEEYQKDLIECCYDLEGKIKNGDALWDCNVFTSYSQHNLCDHPMFKVLVTSIFPCVQEYVFSCGSAPDKIECTSSWFNVMREGGYQEQHIHRGSHVSGIFYLKGCIDAAKTIFPSRIEPVLSLPNLTPNSISSGSVRFPVEENSLILFSSEQPHLTECHTKFEDRITIAFNFFLS